MHNDTGPGIPTQPEEDRDSLLLRIYASGFMSGVASTIPTLVTPAQANVLTMEELRTFATEEGRRTAARMLRDPAIRQTILDQIDSDDVEPSGIWMGATQ